MKIKSNQKGFILSFSVMMVMMFMLGLTTSMATLVIGRQFVADNAIKSTQSYYASEAGDEDALLRLKTNPGLAAISYNLNINGASSNVTISDILGGSRTITSQGSNYNKMRKTQVVFELSADGISFYYGAQVGEGGLSMSNGSRIEGNVFSNSNISGSGTITNSAVIAGNGHGLTGVDVEENLTTYNCDNSDIGGDLTYVTGGDVAGCSVAGTTSSQSEPIANQPLPISQSQIDEWKAEALAGGVITGNYNITNGATATIGPKKISGSLNISNNAVLTLSGTVHVAGFITLSNGGRIKLDSGYGLTSGVIISDGIISISNNAILGGSGSTGSYLLLLSTNTSGSAINVANNATGAVLYTSAGGIHLSNNILIREATGYRLTLDNNAVIRYESGLASLFFSSGPGGGWSVADWKEQ